MIGGPGLGSKEIGVTPPTFSNLGPHPNRGSTSIGTPSPWKKKHGSYCTRDPFATSNGTENRLKAKRKAGTPNRGSTEYVFLYICTV